MKDKFCSLCEAELTENDLVKVNRLADGNILCNNCLERVGAINEYVLYNLEWNTLSHIHEIIKYNIKSRKTIDEIAHEEEKNATGPIPKDYKRRERQLIYQLNQVDANLSPFAAGEIKQLPHILEDDEEIIAATDSKVGILVVTQRNMVYVEKQIFSSVKFKITPNEEIKSIILLGDNTSHNMSVYTKNEGILVYPFTANKAVVDVFFNKIKNIYNKPKPESQPQPISYHETVPLKKQSSAEIFSQLEKLGQLRENGILTDEEFTEQKKKLLEKL